MALNVIDLGRKHTDASSIHIYNGIRKMSNFASAKQRIRIQQ